MTFVAATVTASSSVAGVTIILSESFQESFQGITTTTLTVTKDNKVYLGVSNSLAGVIILAHP
ncbi:MAG: hypothetical protein H6Q68_497 [Firmicutes bacterium]|nr:hypothetical protein [Bacillota bacterium]